jgi:hypothetical protein
MSVAVGVVEMLGNWESSCASGTIVVPGGKMMEGE